MAINRHYDKVEWVEIGYNDANHIEIDNVVSFADRVMSPDGDMVYPMKLINSLVIDGVHHNHKYWEMDMVLDTNYLEDDNFPLQYWQRYLQVQALDAASRATKCSWNLPNNYIEWFRVYVREADGTQTRINYAAEDDNLVWCIGETANINNEIGTRHQTMTFKFIGLGERTTASTSVTHAPGADEAPVKIMRIDNFTIPAATAITNVLRFEDDFVMNMTPQFMPNTFQGLDLKQDQKWRVLTLVVDSEGGALDPYISVTAANTILANDFYVEFTLADGLGTTERWTYNNVPTRHAYVFNRRDGKIDDDVERDTIEYQILCKCDKTITQP